jgi:hypothetical protein
MNFLKQTLFLLSILEVYSQYTTLVDQSHNRTLNNKSLSLHIGTRFTHFYSFLKNQ